jgi:hypothetical protein
MAITDKLLLINVKVSGRVERQKSGVKEYVSKGQGKGIHSRTNDVQHECGMGIRHPYFTSCPYS